MSNPRSSEHPGLRFQSLKRFRTASKAVLDQNDGQAQPLGGRLEGLAITGIPFLFRPKICDAARCWRDLFQELQALRVDLRAYIV